MVTHEIRGIFFFLGSFCFFMFRFEGGRWGGVGVGSIWMDHNIGPTTWCARSDAQEQIPNTHIYATAVCPISIKLPFCIHLFQVAAETHTNLSSFCRNCHSAFNILEWWQAPDAWVEIQEGT